VHSENDDWLLRNEAIDWLAAAQEKLVRDIANGVIRLDGLGDPQRRFGGIVAAQRRLQVGASVEAVARQYPGLFRIFARSAAAGAEHAAHRAGPTSSARPHQRRHGPLPGTTGFRVLDDALCPEIDEMVRTGQARSVSEAARILATNGRVAGVGTVTNRADRLARRYGEWKRAERAKG
jgi:hypothetical protein